MQANKTKPFIPAHLEKVMPGRIKTTFTRTPPIHSIHSPVPSSNLIHFNERLRLLLSCTIWWVGFCFAIYFKLQIFFC